MATRSAPVVSENGLGLKGVWGSAFERFEKNKHVKHTKQIQTNFWIIFDIFDEFDDFCIVFHLDPKFHIEPRRD